MSEELSNETHPQWIHMLGHAHFAEMFKAQIGHYGESLVINTNYDELLDEASKDIGDKLDSLPIHVEHFSPKKKRGAGRTKTLIDPLSLLTAFRYFLPRCHRGELDLIISDIKEDRKEMRKKQCRSSLIYCATLWHAIRTIAAYLWDGAWSLVYRVAPVLKFLRREM